MKSLSSLFNPHTIPADNVLSIALFALFLSAFLCVPPQPASSRKLIAVSPEFAGRALFSSLPFSVAVLLNFLPATSFRGSPCR